MTRAEEERLATFFARPEFAAIRPLLAQIAPDALAPIDAIVRRVRVQVWRDYSQGVSDDPAAR